MTLRRGGDQVIPRPDSWRAGGEPAWLSRDLSVLHQFDEVVERISTRSFEDHVRHEELNQEWVRSSRPSAVLIALVDAPEGPSVVLTRRAEHLRNHKREISFPGGRMDPDELAHEAALREAHEEIGLDPAVVTIVSGLAPITTFVSNSFINPVVGVVAGRPSLVPHEAEVARVMSVPLHDLARADTYRNEWWTTPRGEINIHFFHLDDETVWGATARMLHQFIDIVTHGD